MPKSLWHKLLRQLLEEKTSITMIHILWAIALRDNHQWASINSIRFRTI